MHPVAIIVILRWKWNVMLLHKFFSTKVGESEDENSNYITVNQYRYNSLPWYCVMSLFMLAICLATLPPFFFSCHLTQIIMSHVFIFISNLNLFKITYVIFLEFRKIMQNKFNFYMIWHYLYNAITKLRMVNSEQHFGILKKCSETFSSNYTIFF